MTNEWHGELPNPPKKQSDEEPKPSSSVHRTLNQSGRGIKSRTKNPGRLKSSHFQDDTAFTTTEEKVNEVKSFTDESVTADDLHKDKVKIVIGGEHLFVRPETAELYRELIMENRGPKIAGNIFAGLVLIVLPILIIAGLAYLGYRLISGV